MRLQTQVAREKQGMGNVTNLFPSEVERMLVVGCRESKRDGLAREIAIDLKRRTDALESIESKRAEMVRW